MNIDSEKKTEKKQASFKEVVPLFPNPPVPLSISPGKWLWFIHSISQFIATSSLSVERYPSKFQPRLNCLPVLIRPSIIVYICLFWFPLSFLPLLFAFSISIFHQALRMPRSTNTGTSNQLKQKQ